MFDQPPKRAKRRYRPVEERARLLHEYDNAPNALARAELMRREALYSSTIANWRKQLQSPAPKRGRRSHSQNAEVEQLQRENERLRKRAERAEDLVETLGKVHALLQIAADKSATESQQSKQQR